MPQIRAATAMDVGAIRRIHLGAFPTPAEADLVEQLVRDRDAELSLVAVDGDAIIGHILFSRMRAEGDGLPLRALGLAPVAVTSDRQGEGIGSALIEACLRKAELAGADIIFVLGEPEYYGRFGFRRETAEPFASPYAGPYFQARSLSEKFVQPLSGRAEYAPAFAALT